MNILNSSLDELTLAVKTKKISAEELTQFFLTRIQKYNSKLNAYITVSSTALDQAREIDQRIKNGNTSGELLGLPIGIKDMLCTKGLRTTAGSKILENFIPPYDSTVVDRLKKQGAIILGKLNQDEFAMGSSNETSFFGATLNPWNIERVPGGSSGGSAAAQAMGLCAAAIGTDTGGSIRQPASFCGIVGVKPTYGRISRYGIIAYASSLDQAGPMVNSVKDAAVILKVISGSDPADGTTAPMASPDFISGLNFDLKGKKIGIIKQYISDKGLQPEVLKTFNNAITKLKDMGAEVVEVSIPLTEQAVSVYYLIASSEASSNLSRYDGVKYGFRAQFENLSKINLEDFYSETRGQGFGHEVKRRIILGTHCLSSGYFDAYYSKAAQVRRMIREQFSKAFEQCDVILSPVTTSEAFKIGEKISDPVEMYLNDIFTVSTNLAGIPGMSLPFGMSDSGMPIGVQLMADHFQEQKMLNVALALEQVSPVKGRRPND